MPPEIDDAPSVYHQFVLRLTDRDRIQTDLNDRGVRTLIHYPVPIHHQPAYTATACCPLPLPETESAAKEILSLPMFPELSNQDIDWVAEHLMACLHRHTGG